VFVTSHVLAGALVGRAAARQPAVAFGLGVASHFAMDACPHWGIHNPASGWSDQFIRVAKLDGCTGLAVIAGATWLAPAHSRRSVMAGMAGAALPDLNKPGKYLLGVNPIPGPVDRFHKRIQRESPDRMPHELANAAVLASAVVLVLKLVR